MKIPKATFYPIYDYVALFGLALMIAAIVRAASPFWVDVITETAIAVIGMFFVFGALKNGIRTLNAKGHVKLTSKQKHIVFWSIVTTLIILIGDAVHAFAVLPTLVQLILTAGVQIGTFLLSIISSVFGGKWGLDWVAVLFEPIKWIFQFVIMREVVTWVFKKQGWEIGKAKRKR